MNQKKNFDWLHTAISWGASVVIVGALFKILHLGGVFGNYMIGAGLGVEACLFFLTGFFPPAKDPEWHRVYPELADNYDGAPVVSATASRNIGNSSTAALDKMMDDAKIGPELIESLGSGLRLFGEKVAAISKTADISIATSEFATKIKSASSQFDQLSATFDKASLDIAEMAETASDSKAYHEQVNSLTKNLATLNAVYELELQDSNAHLKSMNKFYQNIAFTMKNFNDSMEDSTKFKEEVGKLAKNLSSMNAIYGNMLTAMSQSRG